VCAPPSQVSQLVILGAGMDTRAYRLPGLASITVYEVDVDEVLSLKIALLSAAEAGGADTTLCAAAVERVVADVSKLGWDGRLVAAGFDWRQPSAWIIEGLVYYLPVERVRALLRCVRSLSCEGSVMCMSVVGEISERREPIEGGDRKQGAVEGVRTIPKFVFACPQPRSFLSSLGFSVERVVELGGDGAHYGRWPKGQPPAENTMYVTFRPNYSKG
jgi:methyltransferase (TIGR00027 family)